MKESKNMVYVHKLYIKLKFIWEEGTFLYWSFAHVDIKLLPSEE
jgi:hypothetical protein